MGYLCVRMHLSILSCVLFVIIFLLSSRVISQHITDGYTDKISYCQGEPVLVYVNADSSIVGWKLFIRAANNTIVDSLMVNIFPQSITTNEPWKDGYGYTPSFTYQIPLTLHSDVYNIENKIFFIVKNVKRNADITIVYPSNTEAAYNESGGKSLYDFNSTNGLRSSIVSIHRPLSQQSLLQVKILSDGFMNWVTSVKDYNFQVISDQDLDDYSQIEQSKILVVIGHSEYWSRMARLNFDSFVNSGKDAIVLSGNTMWWQVRYSDNRSQLICYKNTLTDPIENALLKTITWSTPSLHFPILTSIGVDWPHGALSNNSAHGYFGYRVLLPNSPLLFNTGLNYHDTLSCKSSEYDGTILLGLNLEGDPIVDIASLGFCKIELIGYDWGQNTMNNSANKGYGTFVVFKKSFSSGKIINTGFSNWCSLTQPPDWTGGFGGIDSSIIKKITKNMFDLLLNTQDVFTSGVNDICEDSKNDCEAISSKQFLITPNPSTRLFEIRSLAFGILELEVYNNIGERVYYFLDPFKSYFIKNIDMFGQPNGIYFARVVTKCGEITFKLFLQQ